jgi:RES domain
LIALPGVEALTKAVSASIDERVYRIALTIDGQELIKRCVDANDPLALREADEFFQLKDSDLEAMLDDPFIAKPTERGGKPYWPSRFSNGDHPVFYSSREGETAGKEYAHHAPRRFGQGMGRFEMRLHMIRCRVVANIRDLRALVDDYPGLITNAYDFCNEVGAAAVSQGVESLLALSVRHPQRTNVAAFVRQCISEPEKIRDVIFQIDTIAQMATFNIL